MTRILVVDDEPQILRAMRINLRARHYDVAVAGDGTGALRQAGNWQPDLVVLDLGLPDIDGVDVIHGLRGWSQVPIIVLSGRAGSADKIRALEAGADDYVTKPFVIDELIARIRAVTRRTAAGGGSATVNVGELIVDLAGRTVRPAGRPEPDGPEAAPDDGAEDAAGAADADGAEDAAGDADRAGIHLTRTEWHLLEILLHNSGRLVSQRQLLTEVWGPASINQTHYLRQYMAQLRRKLEPDPARPRFLLTEPGMGYRFQP